MGLALLVYLFVGCSRANTAAIPGPHVPRSLLSPADLSPYVLAYCWQDPQGRQPSPDRGAREVSLVIQAGDGSTAREVTPPPTLNPANVNMLACQGLDPTDFRRSLSGPVWRPRHDELTVVWGIARGLTNLQSYTVEIDLMTSADEAPIGAQDNAPYFLNPERIFWSDDGSILGVLAQDTEFGSHGRNIWLYNTETRDFTKATFETRVGNAIGNAGWSGGGGRIGIGLGAPDSGIRIVDQRRPETAIEVSSATRAELKQWPYALDSLLDFITSPEELQQTLYLAEDSTPVWVVGDAHLIFLAAAEDGDAPLYLVDADGTNLRELLPNTEGVFGMPRLSPVGTELAFIRYPSWRNRGRVEIAKMDLSTQEVTSLVVVGAPENGDELVISGLDWTPDGQFLAFSSNHGGESDIFVIRHDGTAWANLTAIRPGDAIRPAWKR